MKRGNESLKSIKKYYHEIDRKSSNLILYEHNLDGDEDVFILVNMRDECYTYTRETIDYTITNPEYFTWFRLRK